MKDRLDWQGHRLMVYGKGGPYGSSTLYPGDGPADPDPGAAGHDGEGWQEVAIDPVKALSRHCPSSVDSAR